MKIAVGDRIPTTMLTKLGEDGPERVSTEEFFANRRVALFSVPGAYTPTCDANHLPGFIELADELRAKGVDEIACTATNDRFVIAAWAKGSGVTDQVTMLADGNADFVQALGLSFDGSKFGMGTRGQRFSMVVNDGVVEQLHVEEGGEFRVSSASYLLERL